MIKTIAPCTNHIVAVLLSTQCIQCVWLHEAQAQFNVKAYQKNTFAMPVALLQPTIIEQTIRSFLTEHAILNAFVALAFAPQESTDTQSTTISAHQILQCQLLAINTPFHCAGITTQQLAQEYAQEQGAQIPKTYHAITPLDLLCSIGLYNMTLSTQK